MSTAVPQSTKNQRAFRGGSWRYSLVDHDYDDSRDPDVSFRAVSRFRTPVR